MRSISGSCERYRSATSLISSSVPSRTITTPSTTRLLLRGNRKKLLMASVGKFRDLLLSLGRLSGMLSRRTSLLPPCSR